MLRWLIKKPPRMGVEQVRTRGDPAEGQEETWRRVAVGCSSEPNRWGSDPCAAAGLCAVGRGVFLSPAVCGLFCSYSVNLSRLFFFFLLERTQMFNRRAEMKFCPLAVCSTLPSLCSVLNNCSCVEFLKLLSLLSHTDLGTWSIGASEETWTS